MVHNNILFLSVTLQKMQIKILNTNIFKRILFCPKILSLEMLNFCQPGASTKIASQVYLFYIFILSFLCIFHDKYFDCKFTSLTNFALLITCLPRPFLTRFFPLSTLSDLQAFYLQEKVN
jgi:hypothetical protein